MAGKGGNDFFRGVTPSLGCACTKDSPTPVAHRQHNLDSVGYQKARCGKLEWESGRRRERSWRGETGMCMIKIHSTKVSKNESFREKGHF